MLAVRSYAARFCFIAVLALASTLASAEIKEKGGDIGIVTGLVYIDEALSGPDGDQIQPTVGLRGGYVFSHRLGFGVDALYAEPKTKTFRGDSRMFAGRAGLDVWFNRDRNVRWYLNGSLGYLRLSFDNAQDYWSNYASLGFGQRIWLSGINYIRWELSAYQTLAEDGLVPEQGGPGEDLTQVQFLMSWNWGPGGAGGDSDGDGVRDRRDGCPDSNAGWPVDGRGCQVPHEELPPDMRADADGDRVPDALDRCPQTLGGVEVGSDGCFLDADGDGVYDGLGMDRCPDTPAGAIIDNTGCPLDTDGDGVYDGIDRCPDSPAGAKVDDKGCPVE